MTRRRGLLAAAALPVAVVGYFFAYPLARVVGDAMTTGDGVDPGIFAEVLGDRGLWRAVWFTTWQAALSTVLTLVVALPGAYALARFRFRGRALVRALITVPFMLPTLVVASAFLALLGPSGSLGVDLSRTVPLILIAHVFFNYAVVVRVVAALWQHLDPSLEEAARMLGASRWQALRRVTLPLLRPALVAAAVIVFLFSFTSFGIVLVLGGPGLTTIEVEIYRRVTAFLDVEAAAVLAVLQVAAIAALLATIGVASRSPGWQQPLRPAAITARAPRSRGERLFLAANLGVMALLLGAPLLVLVHRSLRAGGAYTLEAYRRLSGDVIGIGVSPLQAVGNSLMFAAGAVAIALAVGLSASAVIAYGRGRLRSLLDGVLVLPLGTSAVTLGLGFIIALDWPFDLRASALLVVVAHALVGIPFVVRTAAPVMRSVQQRLREAAAVMGAGPWQVFRRVDLPLIWRAVAAAAGFAAAISLGEFGATAFVARPDRPTIPIAIFRLLGRPGSANLTTALALSVVLMVLTAVIVLATERLRPKDGGVL